MPDPRDPAKARATRRVRSLAGKLRSPAPGLARLIDGAEGAGRWAVEIPALAVMPFEPLATRAGGAPERAMNDGGRAGLEGQLSGRRGREGATGRQVREPVGGRSGGAVGSPTRERAGRAGNGKVPAAPGKDHASPQSSSAFSTSTAGVPAPRSDLRSTKPAERTQAARARDRDQFDDPRDHSDKIPHLQKRSEDRGWSSQASAAPEGTLPPKRDNGTGAQLSRSPSPDALRPGLFAVGLGESSAAARGAPAGAGRPVGSGRYIDGAIEPAAHWLALLDTLSSRALARLAPGGRPRRTVSTSSPGEIAGPGSLPPPAPHEVPAAPIVRPAAILRPDLRPPWAADRAGETLLPEEGDASRQPHSPGLPENGSARPSRERNALGAPPSPLPVHDAADLADLVNEALIEQARRHGVDL